MARKRFPRVVWSSLHACGQNRLVQDGKNRFHFEYYDAGGPSYLRGEPPQWRYDAQEATNLIWTFVGQMIERITESGEFPLADPNDPPLT